MSTQRVVMVCHGNICRSPMAERVARRVMEREGLDVEVTSAGVSDEERGNPIDRRAAKLLTAHGYDASNHRAHQITADEIRGADLVLAAEPYHLERMRRMVPDADNLRLISDFDPEAPGEPMPDPWYGGMDGFEETLAVVERSMPGLVDWLREHDEG